MATIIYLDVEDEITSAASRIRSAAERRVALVLPFGSRLSTSRINFRLLSREATLNGRRLDVVAPDASARALAASAGLSVFASVAEYEDALEAAASAGAGDGGGGPRTATGDQTAGAAPDDGSGTGGAAALAVGLAAAGAGPAVAGGGATTTTSAGAGDGQAAEGYAAREPMAHRAEPPVVRPARRWRVGTGTVVGVVILSFAIIVSAVAAFIFLPSAEISVTPRIQPIGPISLTVRADPDASAVDAAAGVIPAQMIDVPVEVSGTFPATGKRVEETPATGGVRWTNCDPTDSYTIPSGTVVKTADGIGFSTDEATFLPVAIISPDLELRCQSSEVSVTAVKAGLGGNVAAEAIRVVPARYNRNVIKVVNPSATSGGAREEFPRVAQRDVDAALAQLATDLEAQFATALEDPQGTPPGSTVFPATASLGEPAPDPDPASLVGQQQESFILGLTASGTVLAVDAAPVEAIAEARLEGSISPGYELVDGSIEVQVGDAVVSGRNVSFPVTGAAKQVRPIDAEALKSSVLGLGRDEAQAALRPWGDVQIVLWPDWVGSVPTIDQRVTLVVKPPIDETPSPSPGPAGSGAPGGGFPGVEASGGGEGSEPVPSG